MSDFQAELAPLPPRDHAVGEGIPFHVETYGCQMNVYDSQTISGQLLGHGYRRIPDLDAARVVLLNTCSVRDHAEQKVLSRIGEIRQRRRQRGLPMPVIGVCGCMAERMGEELAGGPHPVDLVVGVDQYDNLPALLASCLGAEAPRTAVRTGHRQDSLLVAPPELYPQNNSHLVTIHKGCDYKCTYCIVPSTRGPQQEKAPDLILAEIRRIVELGGREVTLLGQNVTAYRWDDSLDFAGLLRKVAGIDGLERVRFLTGHPCDMHPHLMDTIGELATVCPWLHVPMQSGSDRILRRMKRFYTRQEYLDMVAYARRVIPGATFSSDFIVGFPGETDEDFSATLEAVGTVKFDQVFSFKYSERPGVPAARLEDDVPVAVKKARLAALMATQEEMWAMTANAAVGETWTGTVESAARRPEGAWLVRTPNNRKIVVQAPDLKIGSSVRCLVTGWRHTTFLGSIAS